MKNLEILNRPLAGWNVDAKLTKIRSGENYACMTAGGVGSCALPNIRTHTVYQLKRCQGSPGNKNKASQWPNIEVYTWHCITLIIWFLQMNSFPLADFTMVTPMQRESRAKFD